MQVPGPIAPGVYPGSNQAGLLRANEQQLLFQQQLIVSGQASIAVQLERLKTPHFYPFGVSFQIWFTNSSGAAADPGTFEVDAETADLDQDAMYASISALTALNASFAGRIELPSFWAKYIRVRAKTVTNAVYSNVLVTR